MINSYNWVTFTLLFLFACGNPINIPDITGTGPLNVSSISIVNNQINVYGQGFQEIRGLALSDPSSGFYKEFTVYSYTNKKIVGLNEDNTPIPVPSGIASLPFALMNLIISTAEGATSIPVTFTLQNDSVFTDAIEDQAVTLEKISKIGAQEGDVIIYEGGQFVLAPAAGGTSGTGGVDRITFGEGILGTPGSSTATNVTIAVDVSETGSSTSTKIPYFNNDNELEISRTGKLVFSNQSTNYNFAISNNPVFSISLEDVGPPQTFHPLITLNENGDVSITSPPSVSSPTLTVGNVPVCLRDGSGCPDALVGTVSTIIGVSPIRAVTTFTGTTVTISAETGTSSGTLVQLGTPIGGVGSLPTVDGTNLLNVVNKITANPPLVMTSTGPGGTGLITLDLPTSGTGSVQPFSQALTDISAISPYPTSPNSVIIANAAGKFVVQSGATFRDSVGLEIGSDVQAYDPDLQTIAGFLPSIGQYILANAAGNWSLANTPNCGASNWLVAGNGVNLTCSDNSLALNLRESRYIETTGAGFNYVGFIAPGTIANNVLWELPNDDGLPGQVLSTLGNGRLRWETRGVGTGDVIGQGTSVEDRITVYADATGKVIKDSGILSTDIVKRTTTPVNGNNLLSFNGTTGNLIQDSGILSTNVPQMVNNAAAAGRVITSAAADKNIQGSGTLLTDIPTMAANGTTNSPVLSGGNNKTLINAAYTIPPADGTAGQILRTNGAGALTWQTVPATFGDVVGPTTATDDAIARFDQTTGKLIQNSVVKITDAGDITGVKDLSVTGAGAFSGDLSARSYSNNSDRTLKKDIAPFSNASAIVDKLIPVTFRWKVGDEKKVIGLIAQDVERVIPEVVTTSNQKGKTIRSYDVGQVLILTLGALKETREELKQTKNEVKFLREKIKELEKRNQ